MGKSLLVWVAIMVLGAPISRAQNSNSTTNETPTPLRADFDPKPDSSSPPAPSVTDGMGEGMTGGTRELEFSLGAGFGLGTYIGHLNHDLTFGAVRYGEILGGVMGGSHWYRGNWEFIGQFIGGAQYNPKDAYVVGLTQMFRYTLATGTRWAPFTEAGFGPTATDIGRPDLSCTFEFNIQAGVGVQYFCNDHHAVIVQCQYFHLSDAGITQPNLGVNSAVFLMGSSWFF